MPYAEPQNMTGIKSIFDYANTVSDRIFGIGVLLSLYLVIMVYLMGKGENAADSSIVAGFFTSITAAVLFAAGMIENWHMFVTFILFVLSLVWSIMSKSK